MRIGANPDPLVIASPTTIEGTLDGGPAGGSGAISAGTFTTPPIEFEQAPAEIVASFSQTAPVTGTSDGEGAFFVRVQLSLRLDIDVANGAIITTCTAEPIVLELRQTAPYDPETLRVTLADAQFAIPAVAGPNCDSNVAHVVNQQLAGTDNSITLTMEGDLREVLPPPPGEASATTLTSAAATTAMGQPATFTAAVARGPGVDIPEEPTGIVTFLNGPVVLGDASLDGTGRAVLATSALPVGVHTVTARYEGDAHYGTSSATLTHTVQAVPDVVADVPATIVAGGPPVPFTAVVTNPISGGPRPNLRLDVRFGSMTGLTNGALVLEVFDGGTWQPVALTGTTTQTGSIGVLTGFSLPPGTSREVELRISATSTVRQNTLPVRLSLNDVDPVSGAVVTTLSTKEAVSATVPATRRTTSITLAPPAPAQVRQGYAVHLRANVARSGSTPYPLMQSEAVLYVDGQPTATKSSNDAATVDDGRVPGSTGSISFFLTQETTRTLTPGVHHYAVRYPGDRVYQPATSPEGTFTVLTQPTAHPYNCVSSALSYISPHGARFDISADVPAVRPSGATVELGRLEVRAAVEAQNYKFSALAPLIDGADPGTVRTWVELSPAGSQGSFESVVVTSDDVEETATFGGLSASFPVVGEPGDVIDVALTALGVSVELFAGTSAIMNCVPIGEPQSLGQVVVSGTRIEASPTAAVEGQPVTLTATVVPPSAQGVVEFFDGTRSVGIAPVSGGTATLFVDDLAAGPHSLTARHLGDLVSPASTSAPVVVEVRAIACKGFALPGDGAVVRLAYLELLGRCPDQAGFDHWVGRLGSGTTPEAFARAISGTPEAVGVVVDDAYRTMLGRPADAAGRAFWVGRLSGHGRYDQLLADLAGSAEFRSLSGGTDAGFVTRVYERLLRRAPDAAGLDHWVGRLGRGVPRSVLVRTLGNLDEPLGVLVTGSYDEILHRAPVEGERSAGIAYLRATGSRSGLDAQLIGHPEFGSLAQGFPNGD